MSASLLAWARTAPMNNTTVAAPNRPTRTYLCHFI